MMISDIQALHSSTQTGESCDYYRRMQLECLRPPECDIPDIPVELSDAATPDVSILLQGCGYQKISNRRVQGTIASLKLVFGLTSVVSTVIHLITGWSYMNMSARKTISQYPAIHAGPAPLFCRLSRADRPCRQDEQIPAIQQHDTDDRRQ